jgi:hypothetical protein
MPDSIEIRIAKYNISLWICWWVARLDCLVPFPLLTP